MVLIFPAKASRCRLLCRPVCFFCCLGLRFNLPILVVARCVSFFALFLERLLLTMLAVVVLSWPSLSSRLPKRACFFLFFRIFGGGFVSDSCLDAACLALGCLSFLVFLVECVCVSFVAAAGPVFRSAACLGFCLKPKGTRAT